MIATMPSPSRARLWSDGRWTVIAGVVGLAALSAPVRAQPTPPPSPAPAGAPAGDPTLGDARELMQLGVKLLKSGDNLGALAVFKDAYKRFPSAKILLNVGTTLSALNRNAEAVNAYQRYVDAPDADPTRRQKVLEQIQKLDPTLGKLEITAPIEAELLIGDDEWVPATIARVYRVDPGSFSVRARRAGYKPFEMAGQIAAGQSVQVAVALEEEPKPVAKEIFITVPSADGVRAHAEEPRSALGALVLGHFDVKGGAAGFVGASYDVTGRIQAQAAAILGSNFGAYVGGSFALLPGTLRPFVAAGFPVFFNSGARVAIRGAGGLEIVANRHFGFFIELGVEHNFNPQSSVDFAGMLRSVAPTSFIPALGATARL
jgi:hypothetical protein